LRQCTMRNGKRPQKREHSNDHSGPFPEALVATEIHGAAPPLALANGRAFP